MRTCAMAALTANDSADNRFLCDLCGRYYAIAQIFCDLDGQADIEEIVCRRCWRARVETLRRFNMDPRTFFLADVPWR